MKRFAALFRPILLVGVYLIAFANTARPETRLYVRQTCPSGNVVTAEIAAAAAAIIPALLDKSIGAVATAIRKASEESKKSIAAEHNDHFYTGIIENGSIKVSQGFVCLILVDGKFGKPLLKKDGAPIVAGDGPFESDSKNLDQTEKKGKRAEVMKFLKRVGLRNEPSLYFEGVFKVSKDESAFRVVPNLLHYPKHLASWSWGRKFESVITISMYPPSNESEAKSFSVGVISLGNVVGKSWASSTELPDVQTRWMSFPPIPASTKAIVAEIQALDLALSDISQQVSDAESELSSSTGKDADALKKAIRDGKRKIELIQVKKTKAQSTSAKVFLNFLPYTTRVELVETRKASKFLALVADLLDAGKDPAKDAVISAMTPKDESAKTTQQESAELAATEARHAVETAELVLSVTDPKDNVKLLAAGQAVALRRLEANAAYRKAGWPIPYPGAQP